MTAKMKTWKFSSTKPTGELTVDQKAEDLEGEKKNLKMKTKMGKCDFFFNKFGRRRRKNQLKLQKQSNLGLEK